MNEDYPNPKVPLEIRTEYIAPATPEEQCGDNGIQFTSDDIIPATPEDMFGDDTIPATPEEPRDTHSSVITPPSQEHGLCYDDIPETPEDPYATSGSDSDYQPSEHVRINKYKTNPTAPSQ